MFQSPQAGLSKDPPCIIVYLEFSCSVIGQALCVLSGVTEKKLFIFKQIGKRWWGEKKQRKKLRHKKMYSAKFQKNLPQGLMYSGIRLDLKAVNRREIISLER